MAVIEITCPHCSARTYVTFVRQTGNGSCPECGNEIIDVFQYSNKAVSGEGTLLTDNFNAGAPTIISGVTDGGDGQDIFGDSVPLEMVEESGPAPLVQSAPALDPSLSGPTLVPVQSAPLLVPAESGPSLAPIESAPMLVPSNSAPTLIPNQTSPAGSADGMLLTPPPPRLRQFATEENPRSISAAALEEIDLEAKPIIEPRGDAETRPTLPPINLGAVPSATRTAVRRPTGSVAPTAKAPTGRVQKGPTGGVQKTASAPVVKPPTGRVSKPPTGSIAKPAAPTRRPTASVAASPAPAAARRPTSPLPPRPQAVPVRRPTGSVAKPAPDEALAPAEELSLLTPPAPPSGTRAVMPPVRKATGALPKPATRAVPPAAAESGGRSYAPIRVPGAPMTPPSMTRPPAAPPAPAGPPKRPTAKLSVVGLGEAPRLAPPEKPKDFAKPKFDAGLTRLGYTMPGSDVSHFDGLPEPSPVPYGVGTSNDADEEPTSSPPPPPPRPGTRSVMPRPQAPKPKEPLVEDYDVVAEDDAVDVPAAAVSKAEITEDWAPAGPNSGVIDKIEIPQDLDDVASDSAATTVPEDEPSGDDEEIGAEFEADAETRQLPQQEKPAPKAAPKAAAKAKPQARAADEGPRPVYHHRASIDWEKVRYQAFIGAIYTLCALALIAFAAGIYHVHVSPLF